jgi:hypothetical protein
MSLNAAANRLRDRLLHVDQIRIHHYRGECPGHAVRSREGIARWVSARLSGGALTLLDQLTLAIQGRFAHFRFPQARHTSTTSPRRGDQHRPPHHP